MDRALKSEATNPPAVLELTMVDELIDETC
jgi:hypothetical protein